MSSSPVFTWKAKEYEYDEKPAEWYWALGIITVGAIVASILFGNYLLAAVFASAAFAIGLQAAKEPREHTIHLSHKGLFIGNRHYSFEMMHSFSVLEYIDETKPPVLSIKTHSLFSPHLMIPLEGVDADAVYALLFAYVDSGDHKETLVDRLIEKLGM